MRVVKLVYRVVKRYSALKISKPNLSLKNEIRDMDKLNK